ncbi:MAG TPA: TetR family transcriptional regulator C-terminal domain-containing protein [Longimicrobiales bacterium]|nr:TetR family transcriptional regulator C-terminal domain-containing protein [Longimicrobiales bacterium]
MPGQKAGEAERRAQILAAAYEIAASDGLARLTVRRVAAEAGLSHGLVHFHFRTKAELLLALLDWVLERTPEYTLAPAARRMEGPVARLLALLRQEISRLTSDRRRVHLFFDFWLIGTRHPGIRSRMLAEFARRRDAFRPMLEELRRAEPDRLRGITVDAMAAALVALIKGAAVQAVLDPRALDTDAFLAAIDALLPQLESAA